MFFNQQCFTFGVDFMDQHQCLSDPCFCQQFQTSSLDQFNSERDLNQPMILQEQSCLFLEHLQYHQCLPQHQALDDFRYKRPGSSVCSLRCGGRRCTSRRALSGCSSCCRCCQTHVFSPTASLTLMKNKLCFALGGPRVEEAELSNLRRCMALLQKEPETQQTELFAAIVLKGVKAHHAVPAVMYSCRRSDVELLNCPPPHRYLRFQTKKEQG